MQYPGEADTAVKENSHPLLFNENMYDVKPSYYSFINSFLKK